MNSEYKKRGSKRFLFLFTFRFQAADSKSMQLIANPEGILYLLGINLLGGTYPETRSARAVLEFLTTPGRCSQALR